MPAAPKKPRDEMLAKATAHLDWAEGVMTRDLTPPDARLALVDTRIALATAWVLLAGETS